MRFIRLVLISVIVLFAVVSFLFALFPSDIRISRVIAIRAPEEALHAQLADFRNWPSWNQLIEQPADRNYFSSHPSSGIGSMLELPGMTVTFTQIAKDTIVTRWINKSGKRFEGYFILVPGSGEDFILQWYFDFHFRWYPWEKLGSMFYDKQIGPPMEKSLLALKAQLERIH